MSTPDEAAVTPAMPATKGQGPEELQIPQAMTPYCLALLVRDARWSAEQTSAQTDLLRLHLAYIRVMIESRHYVLAGPVRDATDLEGVILIAAESPEDAARIVHADPAVLAGRFNVQLHQVLLPSLTNLTVTY